MNDIDKYIVDIDNKLTAEEVVSVRTSSGSDAEITEWRECISQNIINVSARDTDGQVVGVGFLTGNARHAELTDLTVLPEYRHSGIGRKIVKLLVSYALDHKIKYFGLTYDEEYPWLQEFYESEGFVKIDFAMWHKNSL